MKTGVLFGNCLRRKGRFLFSGQEERCDFFGKQPLGKKDVFEFGSRGKGNVFWKTSLTRIIYWGRKSFGAKLGVALKFHCAHHLLLSFSGLFGLRCRSCKIRDHLVLNIDSVYWLSTYLQRAKTNLILPPRDTPANIPRKFRFSCRGNRTDQRGS